jgi:nucleoside-diphosphate-sugar epimerase
MVVEKMLQSIYLYTYIYYFALHNRILLTSTSEVYGDPLEHPQTEEYWGNVNPIGTYPSLKKLYGLLSVSFTAH